MKIAVALIITLASFYSYSQSTVSGIVVDQKGNPVEGANIFLDGTYDGTTSTEDGTFSFSSSATGKQTLVISFLSFQQYRKEGSLPDFQNLKIILKEDVGSLDAVVITAGTFEAGEKATVSVLKPLDIVTTAGSAGNIIAALQTLPGTQNVGESGRLFVRGGEAGETKTFVDGLRVAQPYTASVQNIPARGRFSPFLFSGISFSTGGYSAEFGEALSSVLLLNTEDLPVQTKTEISLMTVGLGFGHTLKNEKTSISLNTSYINLAPYQVLIPQNLTWNKAFESISGEGIFRKEGKSGLWKLYAAYDATKFDLNQEDVNSPEAVRVDLENNNFYLNTSYKGIFGNNWQLFSGISYGYSENKVGLDDNLIRSKENAYHLKGKLSKRVSSALKLTGGLELFSTNFDEDYFDDPQDYSRGYNSNIAAFFAEAGIRFTKYLALNIGLRGTYKELLQEKLISPRVAFAYKLSETSQISMAYGIYNQMPDNDYLKFSNEIDSERAAHYILNYQFNKNRRFFRAEAYLKEYSSLIKYDTREIGFNSDFKNSGTGYARGLDIFWRDSKSIRSMEYWVSYSFIDTERNYRNFPEQVTPNFVADHNASIVTKYFVNELRSQVGFSYNYSTGRPFNDLNKPGFMKGKTKDFNNLSFNWAYLLDDQKILYFSVSNIVGFNNIFGYDYAKDPEPNGTFRRKAIVPTADRFFFIGFFWTISSDKKSNQLENL